MLAYTFWHQLFVYSCISCLLSAHLFSYPSVICLSYYLVIFSLQIILLLFYAHYLYARALPFTHTLTPLTLTHWYTHTHSHTHWYTCTNTLSHTHWYTYTYSHTLIHTHTLRHIHSHMWLAVNFALSFPASQNTLKRRRDKSRRRIYVRKILHVYALNLK